MEKITEIRWHGRGGQGTVTAAKVFANSCLENGHYVQAFPEYGPERSGTPLLAYNRISPGNLLKKAMAIKGSKFLNIISPCNRGWRSKPNDAIELARLAVKTCIWPLVEIENGLTRLTHTPKKLPVSDFLKAQGRFSHLFRRKIGG